MEKKFFYGLNKNLILLFPLMIIIGAVITNLLGIVSVKSWDFLSEISIQADIGSITLNEVIRQVLRKRLVLFLIVWLACKTNFKTKIMYVFFGFLGFGMGLTISVLTMLYGVKFFGIFFVSMFCHMFLYAVSIYGILSSDPGYGRKPSAYVLYMVIYLAGMVTEICLTYRMLPGIIERYQMFS